MIAATYDLGAALVIGSMIGSIVAVERLRAVRLRNAFLVSVAAILTGVCIFLAQPVRWPRCFICSRRLFPGARRVFVGREGGWRAAHARCFTRPRRRP